ncbi:hypothetical protein GDO86_006833 [Hymenochirus boettgeri]|uniref:C2H2-type domain-containing protein n=1 Tax=Hymenochirus boettgeri TaxID=247094 RepID=A0A8T2J7R4_9PIPI|nr:hypothetical protein GDO86_006833 [Hymenochirus boettgeri]
MFTLGGDVLYFSQVNAEGSGFLLFTEHLLVLPVTRIVIYFSSTPFSAPGSEEVRCEFCGEFFENRKGLSSHARSHLRQMGVTEWHVNGSPIDTLREILASGTYPRAGNRVGGSSSDKLLPLSPSHSSPSRPLPYSGLSPAMQRKPHQLPSYPGNDWSEISPLNLSSRADPSRDIRCEFCNEFFENRKGLSSHARSHLRQMGVTEWHVNGSPIDTLREIIRKRRSGPQHISSIKKEPRMNEEPTSPSRTLSPLGLGSSGMTREHSVSPLGGRPPNTFLSPMSPKRPASHEPHLSHSEPKGYVHLEPKSTNQAPAKSYLQGDGRAKHYFQDQDRPKAYVQGDGRPKPYIQSEGRPKVYMHGGGRGKPFVQGENKPKPFMQGESKAKTYTKSYMHGDGKLKTFVQGDGKPKSYLHSDGKPNSFKLKHYVHSDHKPKQYMHGDGKQKAYIQTELPFKVKVKASPDKTAASLEACCELCGLYFENRKALASHARAHLRQFGVTEWCVNGSPIETLREWMKQRPQKAGAYLSYIQGRPFSKKFKKSAHLFKAGLAERDIPAAAGKMAETTAERGHETPSEKQINGQVQKAERRLSKPTELPPSQEDGASDHIPKSEEARPAPRARPVPSLVPRPPQTSLVKFVGNIYTLKCRFCDIQFQGPLSIQEQWVRHLQHHILEMNFSKPLNSPPAPTSPVQEPEVATAQ